MPVLIVICGCGLIFLGRFFAALCKEPKSTSTTHVRFIRARMHRIMAEKRYYAEHRRAA